jgi:hypothetical protein|tara:strand:+ start:2436 stop:2618 length:183 start_codon:yes stop_codon:yes gene_type:complete
MTCKTCNDSEMVWLVDSNGGEAKAIVCPRCVYAANTMGLDHGQENVAPSPEAIDIPPQDK